MAPTVSYAPTVAASLKAQLATALAGSGLEGGAFPVFDAGPHLMTGFDVCIIGDIVHGKNDYIVMRSGRKPRNEEWIQQVWFWVIRPGSEALVARTAAFAAYGKLEDVIANDPSLGTGESTLVASVVAYTANTTQEAAQNGWRVNFRADVQCTVRLR